MFVAARRVVRARNGGLHSQFEKAKSLHSDSTARCFSNKIVRLGANSETYDFRNKKPSPILLTCEHASPALPDNYFWSSEDLARRLNKDHWAYDPGAAEFSLELAAQLECPVVLAKYSRLFVDVNRPLGSTTLMRSVCDGKSVGLNEQLTEEEKIKRCTGYYIPYHLELGRIALEAESKLIISIHSYTKNYEGSERKVQVGILYSTDSTVAAQMAQTLSTGGFPETRINEPWSGKDGFMHSCDSVAHSGITPGERKSLMLEMRNDKLVQSEWRKSLIAAMLPDIIQAVD
mmetsp:Transcript_14400/g.16470  ORF Transcript_14400/g.16470 Transcript_14400/m.16470 type:complete len:289 (-) Transcript_14400:338-1204(-)